MPSYQDDTDVSCATIIAINDYNSYMSMYSFKWSQKTNPDLI